MITWLGEEVRGRELLSMSSVLQQLGEFREVVVDVLVPVAMPFLITQVMKEIGLRMIFEPIEG